MQIANEMGVTQLTVANLEKAVNKDVRLMILKRYVEAAGCKLRLNIELPDGTTKGLTI